MPQHTVRQGETIMSLSRQYGISVELIWDHADNRPLRDNGRRVNLLYPGDIVTIPEREPKEESLITGQRYRIRCRRRTVRLRVLFSREGEPRSDEPYILNVDGNLSNGNLDGDGRLDISIPADAETATIELGEGDSRETYNLNIGYLDPIEEISGIQQRLNNLGYFCGSEDGEMGEMTRSAIEAFQEAQELDVTGEINDETRDRIRQEHGS